MAAVQPRSLMRYCVPPRRKECVPYNAQDLYPISCRSFISARLRTLLVCEHCGIRIKTILSQTTSLAEPSHSERTHHWLIRSHGTIFVHSQEDRSFGRYQGAIQTCKKYKGSFRTNLSICIIRPQPPGMKDSSLCLLPST